MRKFFTSCLLITLCLSGYGQANTSYTATLKKMFEVSSSQEMFKTAVVQMGAMLKQNKEIPDDVWNALEAEILKTSLDELAEMLTPVYQKHLTEEDLKKVIVFFQTPVGAKFAASNPAIMEESMKVGQEWGMKVGQRIMEKLQEKGY